MNKKSFTNKALSVAMLLLFLVTPAGAFAQFTTANYEQLIFLQALEQSGEIDEEQAAQLQQLLILQQLQNQPGQGNNNALQNYALLQALNGSGEGIDPATLSLAMMGGGNLGGAFGQGQQGGGAQGALGKIGQGLSMAGALSGNMGLTMIGMIMSMMGGLGGATPQRGAVDEQYVGQGQARPQGMGSGGNAVANNPYYATPTPKPNPVSTPAAAQCKESLFLVKDTTATPVATKSYPATITIAKDECVLALNSDSAAHTVTVRQQGKTDVVAAQQVSASQSRIFRFPTRNVYALCVDATTACTLVTVQ